jgi:hypothetical protein
MSFGWSASDVVSAVKVFHTVATALRESGGASSEYQSALKFLETLSLTLQHIQALQAVDLNLSIELRESLQSYYEQLRPPIETFLTDIKGQFDNALGQNTK